MRDLTQAAWSRFHAKTKPANDDTGCILWTAARQPNGYGKLGVAYKTTLAHRFAYEMTHGVTLEPTELVLHSCDRPQCVNAAHLRVGTYADNAADMDARGRRVVTTIHGTQHTLAKLTDDIVREARIRRAAGATYKSLADEYGVAVNAIWCAITGKSWSHVA